MCKVISSIRLKTSRSFIGDSLEFQKSQVEKKINPLSLEVWCSRLSCRNRKRDTYHTDKMLRKIGNKIITFNLLLHGNTWQRVNKPWCLNVTVDRLCQLWWLGVVRGAVWGRRRRRTENNAGMREMERGRAEGAEHGNGQARSLGEAGDWSRGRGQEPKESSEGPGLVAVCLWGCSFWSTQMGFRENMGECLYFTDNRRN